jgi:putative transposase
MNTYKRHRFPLGTFSYAVWFYYRFNLSHRDIEDVLAEQGIIFSHESFRVLVHQIRCYRHQKIEAKTPGLWRHFIHRRSLCKDLRQTILLIPSC